jgi:hypothetical protein
LYEENKGDCMKKTFNILDISTWGNASLKNNFTWKEAYFFNNATGNHLTEMEMMGFICDILNDIKSKIPYEKVKDYGDKNIIIYILDNLMNKVPQATVLSDIIELIDKKTTSPAPAREKVSKFDPRNPETYQYATDRQLVIDGVKIYNVYYDKNDRKTKEPLSEKSFVDTLVMLMKMADDRSEEGMRAYIDDYIQEKIDDSKPPRKTKWTYSGYNFSEAQHEVTDGLSEEKLNVIGEIMLTGLANDKRSYQIRQEIFNRLGVDGEWFVRLHHAKGHTKHEHEIMESYFSGYDQFDTIEELNDFFNKNKYLNKNLELKNRVIDYAIYLFKIGSGEEES